MKSMRYVGNIAEILPDEHRVNTSVSFLRKNRRHFFLQEVQTQKTRRVKARTMLAQET